MSIISNLRNIFSQDTSFIDQEGNELSKIDVSRNTLKISKGYIDSLILKRDQIKESYQEDLQDLLNLVKSNPSVALREESQKQRLEDILLQDLHDNTKEQNSALEELKKAAIDHTTLLRQGDFLYKKYLETSLGRKRDTMPQIDSSKIDDVILHFQGKSPNSKVTKGTVKISELNFIQGEINEDKVIEILSNIDPKKLTPFLVAKNSDGLYLIDGAHRISAIAELDPECEVPAYFIHLDPLEAVRRLNLMGLSKNSDIKKGINSHFEDTNYLDNAIESFEIISKAFHDDLVSDEAYNAAMSTMESLLEKADKNHLVKKVIWVTRGGKTFQQVVYVNPKTDEKKDVSVGELIAPVVGGMNISKYSDKAILITGDTYVNKDTLREVKNEIGAGVWNKKLSGWIFPSKFQDTVLGIIWSKLVDTGNEEKAAAVQNQKNAAFEVGDKVTFNDLIGSVIENVSNSDGIKYKIKLENESELIIDERFLPKAPLIDDKKIAEKINEAQPSNRVKIEKQIFGFKAIEDIHNYSLYDYANMHGITQSDIDAYLSKEKKERSGGAKSSPSVTRDKSKPSGGLTKNQIIAKLIAKHKAAVRGQIDAGVAVADNIVDPYEDLKELNNQIKKTLSEEHKRKIAEALRGSGNPELDELKKELNDLLDIKNGFEEQIKDIGAKSAETQDYSVKRGLHEEANKLREKMPSDSKLRTLKNKIQSLENGGKLIEFTDKVGIKYESLPDFTSVDTSNIAYTEDTILNEDRPVYIPEIDEELFARGGYILDMVKVGDDRYIVATNKHQEFTSIKDGYSYKKGEYDPEGGGYVALTLDQLVLTQDYYMTKKKASNKAESEASNKRAVESWFRREDSVRERYMTQRGFYESMPAAIRKKYTKEDWGKMTWKEQEQIYQPIQKHGVPRLKNVFDESTMAGSFHSMYERFIDPEAKRKDRSGKTLERGETSYGSYAHPDVFPKWTEFREMISWKANDLKVQREEYSPVREKALETSYGESNTNDILKDELGILVKRQNGDNIKPTEIEQLKNAWTDVQKSFGNLKQQAEEDNLKLSHAGKTYMYASKAIGVYYPSFMSIGVTAKIGEDQLGFTMGHEVAHWIDNTLGKRQGKRFASDNYDSTAGKLAIVMRRGMNKKTDSKYLNSIHECFARSMEQYHAIETKGVGAVRAGTEFYFNSDSYVNEKTYNEQLKPLIQQFLSENKDLLKGTIFEALSSFAIIKEAFNKGLIEDDQYLQAKRNFDLIKARTGTYADNAQNRQLKRVGQKYGTKGQEDQPKGKQASQSDSKEEKQYNDKELAEHAKNASQVDLERQIKESSDPKIRQAANAELDRRSKEEVVQEEGGEDKPNLKDKIESLEDLGKNEYLKSTDIDVKLALKESDLKDFNKLNKELSNLTETKVKDITSERLWRNSSNVEIDPKTLHSIQDTVGKEILIEKLSESEDEKKNQEPVRVVRFKGKDYIINGTHRAFNASLANENIEVQLVSLDDFKPLPKSRIEQIKDRTPNKQPKGDDDKK